MEEGLLENVEQVRLVLEEVIHHVRKEPVEDLESGINLRVVVPVNELEDQVE